MDWKSFLAYITGSVDQELLVRNAYIVTENRVLRNQIKGRIRLTDGERKTLAEIGKQLSKHALAEVATIVRPETILAWHRKLVAQKCDGSQQRKALGRPKVVKRWKTWWCGWPRRSARGATIVARELCTTWGTRLVIRRWAISSGAMGFPPLQSGRRQRPGQNVFAPIWTSWWPPEVRTLFVR
jgi:hypothetical protein